MTFHAYMLLCADGSFYTGHTDDLDARIGAHNSGEFGGYTARRRPVRLVWSEPCLTRDQAFAIEQ